MNWLLYFIFDFVFYSFFGWVLEEIYCYFVTGSFKKDGFLYGPFKPMYGITMSILVYLYYNINITGPLSIIMFFIIPTIIEFLSGYLLKRTFNLQYWDYSSLHINYKGIISLKFSIYWAILSSIVIIYFQPILQHIYLTFQATCIFISTILFVYIIIDFFDVVRNLRKTQIDQ
ncbi:MAG: putative ABC transporter permease [Clostridiales bacterium]|nr:putative ABC transporter permease [Clostridiales bacterium]